MKQVMFYDVLMKLAFQQVKLHFQKDEVKRLQRQLKVIKRFNGAQALNDDTLEAVHNKHIRKNKFDREFAALLEMMKEKEPKAELVKEMAAKHKNLKKTYNHMVDTNVKIIGTQKDEANKLFEMGADVPVELYTTAHMGSAIVINDFIVEYL